MKFTGKDLKFRYVNDIAELDGLCATKRASGQAVGPELTDQ